jgi:hypothetical protein
VVYEVAAGRGGLINGCYVKLNRWGPSPLTPLILHTRFRREL